MRAAAEPLPVHLEDRREDDIQVTQIPDSSKVFILCEVMGKKIDALVPVSRPARWSFGLYRRGSSTCVSRLILIVPSGPKNCREDASVTQDIIAIAHDDDLQSIEGVVCLSQNAGTYTRRKP